MSIKEEIVKAINEKVETRLSSLRNQYRKAKGKWRLINKENQDRYNLGAMEKLQDEIVFLRDLLDFLNSI